MDKNTLKSLLQSVATNLTAERDEAISKINRLIDAPYDPNLNTEALLTDQFKQWAISEFSIMKVGEAAKQMENKNTAKQQNSEAQKRQNHNDREMSSGYPDVAAEANKHKEGQK